jgi:hypothetical protein
MRDLAFTEEPTTSTSGAGSVIQYFDSHVTLRDVRMTFDRPDLFLLVRGASKIEITQSTFTGGHLELAGEVAVDRSTFIHGGGINLFDGGITGTATISNSLFLESGVSVQVDGFNDVSNMNNTFVGANIDCRSNSGSVKIWDSNIFYNSAGLLTASQCFYRYNIIDPAATVNGASNLFQDPMFTDAVNNDFHLRPGSPAIDAANPSNPSRTGLDRDGTPRPQGVRFDIGAFEARPTSLRDRDGRGPAR